MLEVWGRRNASNVLPVMWLIGELEIPHVRHDLGGSFGGVDTPEYRAKNPHGLIPTIVDGNCVVWESNAIIRYLAAKYGAGTFWDPDPAKRSEADRWMEWFKTTAYRPYIDLFWAIVRTEPALRDRVRIARLTETLHARLAALDARLADRPYVAGDALTMGDIPIGPAIYRWLELEIERPEFPHIAAWYDRLCARPAFRAHAMVPFGRDPAEWYRLEREGVQAP